MQVCTIRIAGISKSSQHVTASDSLPDFHGHAVPLEMRIECERVRAELEHHVVPGGGFQCHFIQRRQFPLPAILTSLRSSPAHRVPHVACQHGRKHTRCHSGAGWEAAQVVVEVVEVNPRLFPAQDARRLTARRAQRGHQARQRRRGRHQGGSRKKVRPPAVLLCREAVPGPHGFANPHRAAAEADVQRRLPGARSPETCCDLDVVGRRRSTTACSSGLFEPMPTSKRPAMPQRSFNQRTTRVSTVGTVGSAIRSPTVMAA